MASQQFLDDIYQIGWTRKRLAAELGITTETLRVYAKNGPTPIARLAVAALAKGIR